MNITITTFIFTVIQMSAGVVSAAFKDDPSVVLWSSGIIGPISGGLLLLIKQFFGSLK